MTDKLKVLKLISRVKIFVGILERKRTLHVHQHISQFDHMQRIAELATLCEQVDEAEQKLRGAMARMDALYQQTYDQWRRDILWLHRCHQCNQA